MNDIFIEQLVKRKRRLKDNVIFFALLALIVLIPVIFVVMAIMQIVVAYFVFIAFFLLLFGIWFAWYVRSHQNVEYEYQVVQNTLVVSKIIAKRKRKEILKVDAEQFDLISKGDSPEIQKLNFTKIFEAAENSSNDSATYYGVFQHQGYGRCALLFSPNERILTALKPYLKKDIVLKLFYNRG